MDETKTALYTVCQDDMLIGGAAGAEAVISIAMDGKLFWHGREVETDADFRAAMLELAGKLRVSLAAS